MGTRVVTTYFDAGANRWRNRIVDGPALPNAYRHRADAEREGRGFAQFLNCEFRVDPELQDDAASGDAVPATTDPPRPPAEVLARAANDRVQALAARLERLESGESEGDDALRAELRAQVAAALAEAAHAYAGLAHEIAAAVHRSQADELDRAGEAERATLQRKAAVVADQLAAVQREAQGGGQGGGQGGEHSPTAPIDRPG